MTEQEIYIEAMNRGDPADRRRFLDAACAGNEVLRQRIDKLIWQSDQLGSFLEKSPLPVGATAEVSVATERAGAQIGPYKLLQPIGEGGMGTVWMAQQTEPVKRLVALKVIKPGMDSRQVIARFEAERQALALMDHPHIARVLDGGTTDAGRPYFVMDLVRGTPITQYCDEHHLTPRQRLELFLPVCGAVQHAHQKGVIHRDLKPSNVLVALYDGKPVPKVIDFGVAKATGTPLTEQTLVTGFGNIVGTLEYMSPEQAEINQLDIDTRSDIYSLGVLLYELLTGSPPFTRKELERAGMLEMLRVIREQEPSRPSAKLSTAEGLPGLAAKRGTEPAKLTKLVRGELDWIVMRALEKDRNRRYETANGLAMDVHRYLADEPVQACPPSAAYRFGKFARRNRGALLIACVALLSVLLALVGLSVSNVLITQEKNLKDAALEQARKNEQAANTQRRIAQRNATKAREQEQIAAANEKKAKANEQLANRRYYAAQMNLAMQAWRGGETPRVLELLEGQRPKPGAEDLRGFEWFYLWRLVNGDSRHLPGHTNAVMDLEFSPDGKTLASASWDWTVRLWDPLTLRQQQVLTGHSPWHLAFSPDGKLLAGASDFEAKNPLWDVRTGERLTTLTSPLSGLAFSADGVTLFSGGKSAQIWDVPSAAQRAKFNQPGDLIGVFPDGKTAVTLANRYEPNGRLHFWDTENGAIKQTILAPGPRTAALSANGSRLAVSGQNDVKIWDTATGKLLATHTLPAGVRGLDFSPDGRQLATGGEDRRVVVWDVDTGERLAEDIHRRVVVWDVDTGERLAEDIHRDTVWTVAFSPDGKMLASASTGGDVKLWSPQAIEEATIIPIAGVRKTQFHRDGKTLLASTASATRVIDVAAGKEVGILPAAKIDAFSALGDVAGGISATAREATAWELPTGREIARFITPESGRNPKLSLSYDGKFAATCFSWEADRTVRVWELATQQSRLLTVEPKPFHLHAVQCAEFSPDGKLLAAGYQFQWFVVWDLSTGREKMRCEQKPAMLLIVSLKFSPDSRMLAVGTDIGAVSLWDMDTCQHFADLRGHTANIDSLAFSPDGEVLATASADKTVRLWDTLTGQERCTLSGHTDTISSVQFSPDGQTLATASPRDGTVRLWRAATDADALSPRHRETRRPDPEPRRAPRLAKRVFADERNDEEISVILSSDQSIQPAPQPKRVPD